MLILIDFSSSLFLKSPVTNNPSEAVTASPHSATADNESIAHPQCLWFWGDQPAELMADEGVFFTLRGIRNDGKGSHISLVSLLGL